MSWRDLMGVACLGGIGFVMALFVAELALTALGRSGTDSGRLPQCPATWPPLSSQGVYLHAPYG